MIFRQGTRRKEMSTDTNHATRQYVDRGLLEDESSEYDAFSLIFLIFLISQMNPDNRTPFHPFSRQDKRMNT